MVARTTGRALIDFWQSPFVESRVSSRMVADMATACREVLSAQANVDDVDLRTCPANELADQFVSAYPSRPRATMAAYKSRFKKAARLYLEYLEDSKDWPKGEGVGSPASLKESAPSDLKGQLSKDLQSYQFPLRRELMLALNLPLDLSREEARRLSLFIESLPIEHPLAGPEL